MKKSVLLFLFVSFLAPAAIFGAAAPAPPPPDPCDCITFIPADGSTVTLDSDDQLIIDVIVDWDCLFNPDFIFIDLSGPGGFDRLFELQNGQNGHYCFLAEDTPAGNYQITVEHAPFQFCFANFTLVRTSTPVPEPAPVEPSVE